MLRHSNMELQIDNWYSLESTVMRWLDTEVSLIFGLRCENTAKTAVIPWLVQTSIYQYLRIGLHTALVIIIGTKLLNLLDINRF